ncbi:CBASS cGAMP-activated phospholipase [Roseateles oligotrophus]|uniref:Patatin-like phospholipase family protein n=1 Tax=Roseateles oligotrophus TaxID=1769250 RepID=A0ABT2YMN9_9BURK|nr:CBASS cGAMP-activated phospholipase [Roseateles oligotrophus]MCV2371334.1 patatin-like phospholipase family protein [Roseateles oligotrophus]
MSSAEPADINATTATPQHALALAGGGFLGLYTATLLDALEAGATRPLARHFDLLAGSSIGAVLALALAFEIPMSRLVRLITEHGPAVFSGRPLPASMVGRLLDMSRSVLGPKYSGERLREALQSEFGDLRLGDALHPVVVPAVDIGSCRAKIFKTPHAAGSLGDAELRAVDVAMASCAAPAYFPSVRIGSRLYADGGLFAVAPDQVALHELEYFIGIEPAKVSMLSIGTAAAHYQPSEGLDEAAGAVGWLTDGRLLMTLISVQQQHVRAMMEDRLGERYLHLDADWPADAGLGIDVATPAAAKRLTRLARETLQPELMLQMERFYGHLSEARNFQAQSAHTYARD